MIIRKSNSDDLPDILRVVKEAFGGEKGVEVSELVNDLLMDASANPMLSLLAFHEDETVGHILFTKAQVSESSRPLQAAILAPLAVVPKYFSQGIGGKLIKEGLNLLTESGVQLVFVLGHPGYYPSHGFIPANPPGFEAPFQASGKAWMVQELSPGALESTGGQVLCADALNELKHWRE